MRAIAPIPPFMTDWQQVNLESAGGKDWRRCLEMAARLGEHDADTGIERKGKELSRLLCSVSYVGHSKSLRDAYTAGKFHAELFGKIAETERARAAAAEREGRLR
jgi:hypothetical protein